VIGCGGRVVTETPAHQLVQPPVEIGTAQLLHRPLDRTALDVDRLQSAAGW
jgi:hypothetical protein